MSRKINLNKLRVLQKQGLSQYAIADELNVGRTTVRSWLVQLGLPTRNAKAVTGQRPGKRPMRVKAGVLRAMLGRSGDEFMRVRDIANEFGVSERTCHRWVQEVRR